MELREDPCRIIPSHLATPNRLTITISTAERRAPNPMSRCKQLIITPSGHRLLQLLTLLVVTTFGLNVVSAHAVPVVLGPNDNTPAQPALSFRHWQGAELRNGSQTITALAQTTNGYLWIGTLKGVLRFDGFTTTPLTSQHLPWLAKTPITALLASRNGTLWIASTGHGLLRYHAGALDPIPTLAHNEASVANLLYLAEDAHHQLVAASDKAIFRLDHNQLVPLPLIDPHLTPLTGIAFDDSGHLWVGCQLGLRQLVNNRLEPVGGTNQIINALAPDHRSGLWFHATYGGLMRYQEGLLTLRANIETSPSVILSPSPDTVWIAGNGTPLLLINNHSKYRFTSPPFTPQSQFQTLLADREQNIWVALQDGLVRISPDPPPEKITIPNVLIESITIDGIAQDLAGLTPTTPIAIRPGITSLEIRFTGIHLANPPALRFQYQLEGLDPSWVESESRTTAYYTHIPAGDYRFRVVGRLLGSSARSPEASLQIRIEPHWWERSTTLFGSVTTALILALSLHYHRINHLKRQKAAQIEFSRRVLESQETERKRISRELHDGLGQSLLVIKNRAFFALQDPAQSVSLRTHLSEIYEASTEAVGEVRGISHALHPPQLERVGLSKTLESIAKQVADSDNLSFQVSIDPIDHLFSTSDQTQILRMVQEGLNNILKHSHASSFDLSIREQPPFLLIILQDDGCGFDPQAPTTNNSHTGLGLLALRERTRTLKGELFVSSEPQQGTTLRFTIPIPIPIPKISGNDAALRCPPSA